MFFFSREVGHFSGVLVFHCLVVCLAHLASLPGDETVRGQVQRQLTIVKEEQESAFKILADIG